MLNFLSTNKTVSFCPNITVKKRLKKIIISGQSRMADPAEYYTLLTQDLESYFYSFKNTLLIDFQLDYLNTGSSKWIYFLLNHLQKLQSKKGMIEVCWMYDQDDETIEESGEILRSLVQFPFRMVQT